MGEAWEGMLPFVITGADVGHTLRGVFNHRPLGGNGECYCGMSRVGINALETQPPDANANTVAGGRRGGGELNLAIFVCEERKKF